MVHVLLSLSLQHISVNNLTVQCERPTPDSKQITLLLYSAILLWIFQVLRSNFAALHFRRAILHLRSVILHYRPPDLQQWYAYLRVFVKVPSPTAENEFHRGLALLLHYHYLCLSRS